MAGRKHLRMRVNLTEHVGNDTEAVARVLKTWAILLADQAERRVVAELRSSAQAEESRQTL